MQDFFHTDFITFKIFHLAILAFLIFAMTIYFKVAEKYGIIDKSRNQNSYNHIAGSGEVVFWLAGILFSLLYLPQSLFFLIGITLICGISFWNDISPLSVSVRLIFQFVAIVPIFFDMYMYYMYPWWVLLITCVVCLGIINACNFMDSIKGMTGLNSLVILGSLQYINQHIIQFVHPDFIIYAILTCVVFLLVGGIGNIGIVFWIIILLLKLILETEDIIWVLFFAVYGVETVCTIGFRIYLRQNIFEPHRMKSSHWWISAIYAAIQLVICIIVISFWKRIPEIMLFSTLLGLLIALYALKLQYNFENINEVS